MKLETIMIHSAFFFCRPYGTFFLLWSGLPRNLRPGLIISPLRGWRGVASGSSMTDYYRQLVGGNGKVDGQLGFALGLKRAGDGHCPAHAFQFYVS